MGSVFISHSWSDKPLARKIAESLRKFAVDVWLDEAEIKLGDSLIQKIRAGIDSVDYVVALLSEKAVDSEWVKKELDIAMNQEIEGKRVKVLPILAEDCSLPGFLKGKLYADMSTPKRFRDALPMLLNRLDIDSDLLSRLSDGESIDEVTKHSEKALDVANALHSDSSSVQYKTLKSLKSYTHKEVVLHPQVLDAVTLLLDSAHPTYLRLEALRVLGLLEDANFAEKIYPFVDDDSLAVARRAIETLAALKASDYGRHLLELLRDPGRSHLHSVCLKFFSRVRMEDDADSLSVVSVVESWRGNNPDDRGAELRAVQVLSRQWEGRRDGILECLLDHLESESSEVRSTIMEAINDAAAGEELWIRHTETRDRLKKVLIEAFRNGSPSEIAMAWLTGVVWYDFDRRDVWRSLVNAEDAAIRAFLFELEVVGYRLRYVFDEPKDVTSIAELLPKLDKELRGKLLDVLAEIPKTEALTVLAQYNYHPSGWRAVRVLDSIAQMDVWNEALDTLLDASLSELPDDNRAKAVSLLAEFRAGRLPIKKLIDLFPRKGLSGHWRYDSYVLENALKKIRNGADSSTKRRLTSLLSAIRRDRETSSIE